MSNLSVTARRTIVQTEPGQTGSIDIGEADPRKIERALKGFATAKELRIRVTSIEAGVLTFKRLMPGEPEREPRVSPYAPLDALQVGESHLFEVKPSDHNRVRQVASARNRRGDVLFSCSLEPGGVRVTRHEPGSKPKRASRWGLERLETERSITVKVDDYAQRVALSNAVHAAKKRQGWMLTTRSLPDGTVMVFKLDKPADQATPTPTTD